MKPPSLRTRMFAWFCALAALLLVGAFACTWLLARHALLESLDATLATRADEIGGEEDADELREDAAGELARADGVRGFEVRRLPDLALVARSASLAASPLTDERLASFAGSERKRFSETVRFPGGADARVFGAKSGSGALVLVVQDVAEIDDELRDVLRAFAVALPAALALAFGAAWLASRHLTRPLREIAAAADRVETAGAPVVLPKSGAGDEVDRLAATLERAFARLADAYARQARFSADAAHELRTPVAVVLAQAEVALRRERTADEYREGIARIAESARRMQETLDALLLLSRGDAGGLVARAGEVDLAQVARETAAACAADAAAKSVDVRLVAPEPAPVAGDARLLAVLVRNLLANAVVHGRPGGVAEVSVSTGADAVVLSVRDDGRGIPAEALPHVFERFFRADDSRSRATGGAGLGLSLVRLVAQAHGGTASIESAPGQGTRVTVRLPKRADG